MYQVQEYQNKHLNIYKVFSSCLFACHPHAWRLRFMLPYTLCPEKSLWFTMHNVDKFKYIFIIFGKNHPDTSFR